MNVDIRNTRRHNAAGNHGDMVPARQAQTDRMRILLKVLEIISVVLTLTAVLVIFSKLFATETSNGKLLSLLLANYSDFFCNICEVSIQFNCIKYKNTDFVNELIQLRSQYTLTTLRQ